MSGYEPPSPLDRPKGQLWKLLVVAMLVVAVGLVVLYMLLSPDWAV